MRHFGLSGAAAEELKKTVQDAHGGPAGVARRSKKSQIHVPQELLLTWQTQESEREYTQGLNELLGPRQCLCQQ